MKHELDEVRAVTARVASLPLEERRAMIDEIFHAEDTIVFSVEAIAPIMALRELLYNPADKGMGGKLREVEERLIGYAEAENPRRWVRWSELHARKTGRADLGRRTEVKSGAGDWLRSLTHHTWEGIIREYRNRQTEILWATDAFRIRCTWAELLGYLESYNAKGLTTWFKAEVKTFGSESVLMLQTWSNSKKKVAFLQACPWNEEA